MDGEGCKWDIFKEATSDVISQFSQFVVEFHGLSWSTYDQKYLSIVSVLKKINQTYQSIHVHVNGTSAHLWIGEFVLPLTFEVTYIRRTDVKDKLIVNTRQLSTEIDQPTFVDWPDTYLGSFPSDKE